MALTRVQWDRSSREIQDEQGTEGSDDRADDRGDDRRKPRSALLTVYVPLFPLLFGYLLGILAAALVILLTRQTAGVGDGIDHGAVEPAVIEHHDVATDVAAGDEVIEGMGFAGSKVVK